MEYIDPSLLESYEHIIEEINREHERSDILDQKIKKADDEIIALKIALSRNEFQKHISVTNVKIFNNIFDIYNLYKEDFQLEYLLKLARVSNQKYYLIEIYVSELLVKKIIESWSLMINIYNKNFSISRVMKLSKKLPILEVIPVNGDVIDSELDTILYLSSGENIVTIELDHIDIDVSYHFEIYRKDSSALKFCNKYTNITKLYNRNTSISLDHLLKPMYFEYKINSNLSKEEFIKLLLRNSYHRLDIELFSELSIDSEKSVSVTFGFNTSSRCIIKYDPKSKNLNLKCTPEDLCVLKRYILQQIPCVSGSMAPSTLQTCSLTEISENRSLSELREFVEERRKLSMT